MRPIVQSVKHYVQQSLLTIVGGTASAFRIVNAVDQRTGNADDILNGAVVKAVFIEMWVRSAELTPGTILVSVIKTTDLSNPTFGDSVNLHDYTNKKNVLYHTQGLTNENSTGAIPFVRQWFKIPKGKQRFGLGDRLFLMMSSQAVIDNIVCGFATYKEYS